MPDVRAMGGRSMTTEQKVNAWVAWLRTLSVDELAFVGWLMEAAR